VKQSGWMAVLTWACLIFAATPATAQSDLVPRTRMAPAPFTAEQVREACPEGRRLVVRIAGPAGTYRIQTTEFTKVSESTAWFTVTNLDERGRRTAAIRRYRSSWGEFLRYDDFPAERTRTYTKTVRTALGRYRMKVYEVTDPTPRALVKVYYFAESLPGPPLRVTVREDGGEEFVLMEMIERSQGRPD